MILKKNMRPHVINNANVITLFVSIEPSTLFVNTCVVCITRITNQYGIQMSSQYVYLLTVSFLGHLIGSPKIMKKEAACMASRMGKV